MAISLRIEGVHRSDDSNVLLYQLRVTAEGFDILLHKRYSQFLELHRVMKMRYHSQHLEKLPRFPGKKTLKQVFGGLSEEDIEERRRGLEVYMRALECNANSRESHYFLEFLQLPKTVAVAWLRYQQAISAGRQRTEAANQC